MEQPQALCLGDERSSLLLTIRCQIKMQEQTNAGGLFEAFQTHSGELYYQIQYFFHSGSRPRLDPYLTEKSPALAE